MRGVRGDMPLLAAAHLLTAIGFALLVSRADPLRDNVLFVRYTLGVVLGLAALSAASLVDFRKAAFLSLSYVPVAAALLLSLALMIFGDGPGHSRARVNLGPVQPIELPGIILASFATLSLGVVLGPEAPLIAIGSGMGVLAVHLIKRDQIARAHLRRDSTRVLRCRLRYAQDKA